MRLLTLHKFMAPNAVDVQGVTQRYGTDVALRDVTFQVESSTLYGLLGPNGSGKTTLFRILSTLLAPSEGKAHVFGRDVVTDSAAVRKQIGVVFQEAALDENLTVVENLRFQGALYNLRGSRRDQRIRDLLRVLEVSDRAHDRVSDLSGGLRRRVDLARGLLHHPDLLLLDEPTSGLDPAARRTFFRMLEQFREAQGTTLVLATHLMEEAEQCDRVGILSDGALVVDGAPGDLKAELGEETLWVESDAPAALSDRIDAQFGIASRIVGDRVQLAPPNPPAFLSALYDAMGSQIRSATIRRPTLEDVFMIYTGVTPSPDREEVLASAGNRGDAE